MHTQKHRHPFKHTGTTSPLAVTYYTTYSLPRISPFYPIQNLLYLVSSKDGGKKKEEEEEMDKRDRWAT